MPWTPVARRGIFGGRDVVGIDCGGRRLALYALGDDVFATADACPHLGGALSAGCLVDGHIECPQHYALFDVRTGASDGAVTAQSVRTFPVKIADDLIYVDLPPSKESALSAQNVPEVMPGPERGQTPFKPGPERGLTPFKAGPEKGQSSSKGPASGLPTITPGYMSGFGNGFETEALPGALPIGRNSPQRCAYGLYAEQLSGSPFTAPRATNERSWLYRIRPTVAHFGDFAKADIGLWRTAPCHELDVPIAPIRWSPVPLPDQPTSFLEGVRTITTAGDAGTQAGMGAHVYVATRSMVDEYFYDADGELLFVPQSGSLRLVTEFGVIDIEPGEIALIPRGVKMRVELTSGPARGYLCENYGGAFTLPDRGPIGANCLANPRDFLTPVAAYEDRDAASRLYVKWGGALWTSSLDHSPLDVVAWHGNYAPYKYDLRRYSPVGPVLYDHADPSIFTVLTSPSETPGTANVDFVIFPDRWLVAENTFRPPWYHMNVMSEFMGLVYGQYDAKPQGFVPGGFSLHNTMLPHGPDAEAFETASTVALVPKKLEGTMAFMFETRFLQRVTAWAASMESRQDQYARYGRQLKKHFDPSRP